MPVKTKNVKTVYEKLLDKATFQYRNGEISEWEYVRITNLIRRFEKLNPVWFDATLIA